MIAMFCGEVIEHEQRVAILHQALDRLPVFQRLFSREGRHAIQCLWRGSLAAFEDEH